MVRLLYDPKLRRPACAMLQAAARCDHLLAVFWPSALWLAAPTAAMRLYEGTLEQVKRLAALDRAHHKEAPGE